MVEKNEIANIVENHLTDIQTLEDTSLLFMKDEKITNAIFVTNYFLTQEL